MGVLETFLNNLLNSGVNAVLDSGNQSLLSQLNPFGAKIIGRILLQGRQIDEIELFGHYETHETGSGIQTRHTHLNAVDVDYILKADITGRKQLLEARLNVKRTGLIHRKVEDMHWEGNVLANMLNKDSSINELLEQSLGQLSARDIEIKPDEGQGRVEIHVRDDSQIIDGKLPPIQLYEKIAEYIYALAGISKTVNPIVPPPEIIPLPQTPDSVEPTVDSATSVQTEVPQQPAVPEQHEIPVSSILVQQPSVSPEEPSHVVSGIIEGSKYCYKCGKRMPDDSLFCPKCGVRQDE